MTVRGFGVFSQPGKPARVGWRDGDRVFDLSAAGFDETLSAPTLNPFMSRGRRAWDATLERIEEELEDVPWFPLEDIDVHPPFAVADFVDFYASLWHATNFGRMLRPNSDPLVPSWRYQPLGYHGRAGTVVVSGSPIVRPVGQILEASEREPRLLPSRKLDFELELGFVVGAGSRRGEPVAPSAFAEHVFGVVLVNDWSARDIQTWEYQPLGPFLSKSFATTIGAWITPLALLDPVRIPASPQEPPPLPYLTLAENWVFDVELEVELNGEVVSRSNTRHVYWSPPQLLAHLTVNGADLRTGDLIATGTISGPEPESCGSLMELTWNGERPLGSGQSFLADGDTVTMRGRAGTLSLAEAAGTVAPATQKSAASAARGA